MASKMYEGLYRQPSYDARRIHSTQSIPNRPSKSPDSCKSVMRKLCTILYNHFHSKTDDANYPVIQYPSETNPRVPTKRKTPSDVSICHCSSTDFSTSHTTSSKCSQYRQLFEPWDMEPLVSSKHTSDPLDQPKTFCKCEVTRSLLFEPEEGPSLRSNRKHNHRKRSHKPLKACSFQYLKSNSHGQETPQPKPRSRSQCYCHRKSTDTESNYDLHCSEILPETNRSGSFPVCFSFPDDMWDSSRCHTSLFPAFTSSKGTRVSFSSPLNQSTTSPPHPTSSDVVSTPRRHCRNVLNQPEINRTFSPSDVVPQPRRHGNEVLNQPEINRKFSPSDVVPQPRRHCNEVLNQPEINRKFSPSDVVPKSRCKCGEVLNKSGRGFPPSDVTPKSRCRCEEVLSMIQGLDSSSADMKSRCKCEEFASLANDSDAIDCPLGSIPLASDCTCRSVSSTSSRDAVPYPSSSLVATRSREESIISCDRVLSFLGEQMSRMDLSQKLPSDIAVAVAAIKKGRKVSLKELQRMLDRLKHVDPPFLVTAFRPSYKYSYAFGSRYPGTVFGHRDCTPRARRVPAIQGWRWDTRAPIHRLKQRLPPAVEGAPPEGTWRPGAICNSLRDRVKAPQRATRPFGQGVKARRLSQEHLPLNEEGKSGKTDDEDNFDPKPTLHIHRYQGDYFVSMHPDDMAGENVPLQFRIINKEKKPVTCQDSDSELEIELFQPGAFYTPPKHEQVDMKTQCEEQFLVENYQPPLKIITATEIPKPIKPDADKPKAGKGGKKKGGKKGGKKGKKKK